VIVRNEWTTEMPWKHKYGESKTTQIMMATVRHITSGAGCTTFQATWFLLDRVSICGRHNINTHDTRQLSCICQLLLSGFPRCPADSGVLCICADRDTEWICVCMIWYRKSAIAVFWFVQVGLPWWWWNSPLKHVGMQFYCTRIF